MKVRTSVVLAGGLSRRFGSDKLMYEIEGSPIIERVVKSAATVAEEVLVITNTDERAEKLSKILEVDVLADGDVPCKGPVRGILTAGYRGPTLVLPADLPWVNGRVLHELVWAFDSLGSADVHGVYKEGNLEPLIMLITSEKTFKVVEEACFLKGGRASDFHRAADSLLLLNLRSLAEGWRLMDADRPEDLKPKPWVKGSLEFKFRRLNSHYLRGLKELREGNFLEAAGLYELEALTWDLGNVRAHCLKDSKRLREKVIFPSGSN